MEKKYRALGYVLLLLIPLIFAGFYKTYFENFPQFNDSITYWDHIHGAIASVWILTLIIQPLLIRYHRNDIHRTVGKLSYFVFPLLVLSFIPGIFKVIHRGDDIDLFFPLADVVLLITFYLLAIYNRKNVQKHMRYMIAAALVFLGPTIGRIGPLLLGWPGVLTQYVQYSLQIGVLFFLILYDHNLRKSRPYLVAISFFALHQAVFAYLFVMA